MNKLRLFRWHARLVVAKDARDARTLIRQGGYDKGEVRGVQRVRRSVELIYDPAFEKSAMFTPSEVVARRGRIDTGCKLRSNQMKIDSWSCDICGAQKKEANHWFKAYTMPGGVIVNDWETKNGIPAVASKEKHLCGADCVTQWLSKTLLGRTS